MGVTRRLIYLAAMLFACPALAQGIAADVSSFVETSCTKCHGADTQTPLDMSKLGLDLSDHTTFNTWVRIYERVQKREMPPRSEPRIKRSVLEATLSSLKSALVEANIAARGEQRTPLRRLTRPEYAYTLADLLHIDEAVALELAELLPEEADTGGFDTIAEHQAMSPLHVRSYLTAADRALDEALKVGPRPTTKLFDRDYIRSPYLPFIVNGKQLGLGIIRKVEDAYVAFFEYGSTYTFHSQSERYEVPAPGRYRVAVEAYPYQATSTVGLAIYKGRWGGIAASLDELIGAYDLEDSTPKTVELETYLKPGDLIAPAPFDVVRRGIEDADGNAHNGTDLSKYEGEGVALKSLTIEGPLYEQWPPESSRQLLTGIDFGDKGALEFSRDPFEHVLEIVEHFAVSAFRRPLVDGEVEAYAGLAKPLLDEGRPFLEVLRVPLRAILTAPGFIYHAGSHGELDAYALASRLSYFLWRSMPDETLLTLAREDRLSEKDELRAQVERMLKDSRSTRFINDFVGQAFRLNEMKATTPDMGLYPEFDDRLGQAMRNETELFLTELFSENLSVEALIDSDFTFVNRRLAKHYGIPGVKGQEMRKVKIPEDNIRGGLLTQASIHKVTANGSNTSPIPRGNFVLANLLGTPAPPPPPGIEAVEPDIRGTSTIREQLDAHRNVEVCASCHRLIDPPGFALEEFDPVGNLRTQYRKSGGMGMIGDFPYPNPYKLGREVDASGISADGHAFSGIEEYKIILMENETEQIARHMTSQLLAYSTGAEIEFADRDAVDAIVDAIAENDYPMRDMIHAVVQSELFRRP